MDLSDIVAGVLLCAGIAAVVYDVVQTYRTEKSSEE